MPAEIQKPPSAKDIERAQAAQSLAQFDSLADGMARFSKIVSEMKREGTVSKGSLFSYIPFPYLSLIFPTKIGLSGIS